MSRRHTAGVLVVAIALGPAACDDEESGESEAPSRATEAGSPGGDPPKPPANAVGLGETERRLAAALPDLPVWLPAPLPAGTRVESVDVHRDDGRPYAQVQLDMGDRGPLQLQYGQAGFDGCPSDVRPASVAGQKALVARATPPGKLTTVIWPVRDPSDPGSRAIYGVGAELPPKAVIDLAAAMSRYTIPAPRESSGAC